MRTTESGHLLVRVGTVLLLAAATALAEQPQERAEQPQDSAGQKQDRAVQRGAARTAGDDRASQAGANLRVRIAQPPGAEPKRALSGSGARLLHHVEEARQAVADEDREDALRHIEQGMKLARAITSSVPEHAVKQTIRASAVAPKDREGIMATLVPIYTELELTSILRPIESAKRSAAKVAARGGPEDVPEIDLRYTRILLNPESARANLRAARSSLRNEAWDQADATLAAIQSEVILHFVEADLPLLRVSRSLALARQRADDQPEEAQAALEQAAELLDGYARTAPAARAQAARDASDTLGDLAEHFAGEQEEPVDQAVVEQIDRTWNQIVGWMS